MISSVVRRRVATSVLVAIVSLAGCQEDHDQPSNGLHKWPANYPIDGDSVAVVSVSIDSHAIGAMTVEFYPDSAPNHVRNFKWLTNNRFYDGLLFHRVINGFIVQGGDPTGTGSGSAPWTVNAEFNGILHTRGILSMARAADPNSAGSQFFIMLGAAPWLDWQYTVFGNLLSGYDVLDSIANVPTTGPEHSTPVLSVVMDSVRIIARPVM